jgi:hypothetical protein
MIFRQRDFTGGENLKILSEYLKPNQLVSAQNCELTAEGLVQTRRGKVKINTTTLGAGGILTAFVYPKENGTNYLVAQHGTSLYAKSWDGEPFTAFPAAVKATLGDSDKLRGEVWKDNLILGNATVNPFRFDGTTCTDLGGSPPKFSHMAVYAGRLWGIVAATPNIIRYSDLENYDSWPALNIIKVRDGDGDFLTGIHSTPGGLLLTKTKSLYAVYGTSRDNLRLSEPLARVGSFSPDTLLPGIMQGMDNWYFADLNGATALPETHTPILDSLTAAQKAASIGHFNNLTRKAFFALPNGQVVAMDGKYQGITTWTGLNVACFTSADAEGLNGGLIIGDATNGNLYTVTGDDDDGAAIQTIIKLAYNDYGSDKEKIWRYFAPHIDLLDQSGNFEIFAKYDIDYRSLAGLMTTAGTLPNILEWGVDDWGGAYWGSQLSQLNNPYWLHGVRGGVASFEIKTNNRILFRGYEANYQLTNRISGVR